MGLLRALAWVAMLVPCTVTAQSPPKDLGSVLAAHTNLSHYYGLIKKYPDVLLKLPSSQGVTILAPSNAAFENIPGTRLNGVWNESNPDIAVPLLEYHILQGTVRSADLASGPSLFKSTLLRNPTYTNVTGGQNVIVNKQPGDVIVLASAEGTRSTIVETDIEFSGGLIQIVDNLLIPPTRLEAAAETFKLLPFLGGLYLADMMPGVAEQPNVTIFVPRSEAFRVVAGSLNGLDKEGARKVVSYHIVPGRVLSSAELVNDTELDTAGKAADGAAPKLRVRRAGNNLYVNSAQVVQPDILIANGVLHIIDNVLNPNAPSVIPNPEVATQAPAFDVATASGLPFTTALPCTVNCPTTTTAAASVRATTTRMTTGTSPGAGVPACTGIIRGIAAGVVGAGIAALV